MKGRWVIFIEEDWHEVIPCDDAAVERAAVELARRFPHMQPFAWPTVEAMFRAAKETP